MPDLTHLKPGDKIAFSSRANSWRSHIPLVSHELFTITKTTPTQIAAKNEHGHEARVRRSDGALIGGRYSGAIEATPDLIAEHEEQVSMHTRWNEAQKATDSLIGKELHQLKLTTDQLERLAIAWAEIQAMS